MRPPRVSRALQLDRLGADHAGELHGAFGGRSGLRSRVVHHAPAGDAGQHLGVHGGRRQAAHQLLGAWPVSSQPSPRPSAWTSRERWTQNQAARSGSLVVAPARSQGALGDRQGALALAAQRGRRRRPRPAGRGSAAAWSPGRSRRRGYDLGVVDGAQPWRVRPRGRRPTAPWRVPAAAVARSRRGGGGPRRRRRGRRAAPWRRRGRGTSSWPAGWRARRRGRARGRPPGPRRSGG